MKNLKETGAERGRRIAQETSSLSKHEQRLKLERAKLSKLLGFDCENGGRRFGELTITPCEADDWAVHLAIDTTVVTIEQAIAIRKILVGGVA